MTDRDKTTPTNVTDDALEVAQGGVTINHNHRGTSLRQAPKIATTRPSGGGETLSLSVGYSLDKLPDDGETPPATVDFTIEQTIKR